MARCETCAKLPEKVAIRKYFVVCFEQVPLILNSGVVAIRNEEAGGLGCVGGDGFVARCEPCGRNL